ncbi:MAG: DUF971 domain-containing protein [Planctomycetaceae bacterium]|nr:DUF971 domain-containing protein [Planctomycetaceae bacterium]
MQSPSNIKVHKQQRVLELIWSPDDISQLPFQYVRQHCRCAVCVDEFTGKQLLDPLTIPADLDLVDVALAGNYAMKFRWSDGHDSGLFTWDHLRQISQNSDHK